jgi:hypothetical protein
MTEWTSEARKERDQFLNRQRQALTGLDINADEVVDDMRRHIDEELKGQEVITRDDVARVTRSMGPMEDSGERASPPQTSVEKKKRPGAGLILLGVILPLIALIFELASHACAGAFFDPIPTWWHVLLVASVPLVNGIIIYRIRNEASSETTPLLVANAATIVISLFYTVAFAPLCIPGLIAIFYFGFGLLPMAPLFGSIACFFCRSHLLANATISRTRKLRAGLIGAMIGIACLTALEFTNVVTRIALEWADDENPRSQNRGIRALRWAGNENTMLRACYERPRKFTNLAALVISRENTLNQSEARTIFFRVTGKPFNAVRPPSLYSREGRWEIFDEMTWEFDNAQGGTSVAGRVRGLSLTGSRMDCRVHSQAGLAYLEWTFEFANQSTRQREARTQILLPVNGVVSRLTLWVNGEEREAAFAGRAEVRAAYENIVRQRRDPVLVTTSGPDRVLMQCFPVPPNGGTMKTRIGITLPLTMFDRVNGKLQLPKMIERNFNLAPDLEHAVWVESRSELVSNLDALISGTKVEEDSNLQTLHGQLIDSELLSHEASIHVIRAETPRTVWTRGIGDSNVVIQKLEGLHRFTPDRLVIVADGSKGMAAYYDEVAQALESLPRNVELYFLHASDMQSEYEPRTAPATSISTTEAATHLTTLPSGGGQDNLKWLVRGWDIAAAGNNGAVLWIHGPQPVSVSSDQALKQRMERSPQSPRIFEIQTVAGPNRLLEDIGSSIIRTIPRYQPLEQDLRSWFEEFVSPTGNLVFNREQQSIDSIDQLTEFPEVTDHVRRLWAAEAIEEFANNRNRKAATQLAQQQQLVSSVSGAVVLETKEQFENAGLEPVDVGTVPVIPEPSTWLLFGLGLFCLWARGLRSRTRNQQI